ncbi:ABC transporter substrate-binding protein [Halorarum halobium]|uniref:ABC transporter substrate-binding protein n=1 Tax=Halorarum halobium TaxID=3075121 RepID=UPI0028ADDDAC|nr:ABC transporter substrate-binding protein [Halobaculum sp. XH14]
MQRDETKIDRRTLGKLVGSASIAGIAGCSGSSDPGTSEPSDPTQTTEPQRTTADPSQLTQGGELGFFQSEIAPSLDPHFTRGFGTLEMVIGYDQLFTYDQDLEWRHDLATDINIPDDTTYVFPLREGVTFHDGSEWNAEVAKWNFDRMRSDYSDVSLGGIDEVEASGDMELTIHLEEPFAPFLDDLNSIAYFVSRAALEGEDDSWMQKNPVGTGPFVFDSWNTQDNVLTFVANDDYWRTDDQGNQLPYLDSWQFRAVPEPSTMVQAYQDEGNYLHSIPADSLDSLRESSDHEVANSLGKSNTIDFFAMNTDEEPFDDPLVREAVYYAIDNEAIRGFTSALQDLTGPLPDANWGSNNELEPEYDPERARSLLEEAGRPDGFDFTVKVWNSQPWRRQVTTVAQDQLSQVGINAEIEVLEVATVLEHVNNGNFQMYNGHWGGGGALDPYGNLNIMFHSEGTYNTMTNYTDPEIDRLLDEAVVTPDREERAEKYKQVEELIFNAHPMVWYGAAKIYVSHFDEVNGVVPVSPTGYFPTPSTVWIDQDE